MSTPATQFLGETKQLPLTELLLDPFNPRLPEELQDEDQEELAVHMALGFDALTVAESIASHGYFTSEPLIAIPRDGGSPPYIVVEGNRRLTALLGLADQAVREQFAEHEKWEKLAQRAGVRLDMEVPVVIAPDRRSVTPIIGFRHISGILQWQPYAQARYIAKLVEDDGMSFAEVAEMIGIERTKVGNLYRDQAIADQANELGIDTGNIERSFSLLTVATSTTKLRSHIGAPIGSQANPGVPPVPPERAEELRELLTWVFGDGATKPVITDSREISKLGNVVASKVGLDSLRKGESLEQAVQKVKDAGADPLKRLVNRLRAGRNSLLAASEDLADFVDNTEVLELVDEIEAAVDALRVTRPDD